MLCSSKLDTSRQFFHNLPSRFSLMQGSYSVSNISSTILNLKVPPAFYYGKFRVTATLVNSVTNELVACERAFLSVLPKLPKRKPSGG